MIGYIYIPVNANQIGCATVGFYTPEGQWIAESDHTTDAHAAARVHWLNGGNPAHQDLLSASKEASVIIPRLISIALRSESGFEAERAAQMRLERAINALQEAVGKL